MRKFDYYVKTVSFFYELDSVLRDIQDEIGNEVLGIDRFNDVYLVIYRRSR